MVFRRLFDRSASRDADAPAAASDTDAEMELEEGADEPGEAIDDVPPEEVDAIDWAKRAREVIRTGSSTGSKRPAALYGTEAPAGPTHFVQAHGCHVVAADGNEYLDCTMALGAVTLGYAEPRVARAAAEAALHGNVAGLAPVREVELAERLSTIIPCAEQVQFLKSGAEAVSAAVRIARAATGRDLVVCSGYFGWHDWANEGKGIPASARADVRRVPFDDVAALERATAEGNRLAAIVIEPVIERLPSEAWIAKARAICDATGAALVFDECKTGFRLRTAGYQELSGVTPDLAVFGKGLANGFPLSVVCGTRAVMEAAGDAWISSTLASENVALSAAGAVLDWYEEADIPEALARIGGELRGAVDAAIQASGLQGIETVGIDPMWLIRFDDPARETRFLELAAQEGVLFKRGAYNYASVAHDEDAVAEVERAASAALVAIRAEAEGRA